MTEEYLVTQEEVVEWSSTLPDENIVDTEYIFNNCELAQVSTKYNLTKIIPTDIAKNDDGVILLSTSNGVFKIENQEIESIEYIEVGSNINWNSIAYGNGLWVMCGGRYIASSSDDGETWSIIKSTNSKYNYKSVTFGNGFFIIVGDIEMMFALKSSDGKSWSLVSSNATTDVFKKVIFAENKFIAIGENNILAYSDTSGSTWSSTTISNTIEIKDIIYTNTEYIMYGTNSDYDYIAKSTDLTTWTAYSFLDSKSQVGISYMYHDTFLNQLKIYMKDNTVYQIDYNFLDWTSYYKQYTEEVIDCNNLSFIYSDEDFYLIYDGNKYFITNRTIKTTIPTVDLMQKYLIQNIGDLYYYSKLSFDVYTIAYSTTKVCTIDLSAYFLSGIYSPSYGSSSGIYSPTYTVDELEIDDILVELTQFTKYNNTSAGNRTLAYEYDNNNHVLTITSSGNLFAANTDIFANVYVRHKISNNL